MSWTVIARACSPTIMRNRIRPVRLGGSKGTGREGNLRAALRTIPSRISSAVFPSTRSSLSRSIASSQCSVRMSLSAVWSEAGDMEASSHFMKRRKCAQSPSGASAMGGGGSCLKPGGTTSAASFFRSVSRLVRGVPRLAAADGQLNRKPTTRVPPTGVSVSGYNRQASGFASSPNFS